MIKAIAIDDEPPALKIISTFSERSGMISLQAAFSRTDEALNFLVNNKVELIFLDINMPSMNGIELSKHVPKETMVIFTTAYSEYAVEGFNLNAVDFLLKPFTLERFVKAVEKAKDYRQFQRQKDSQQQRELFIPSGYESVKINPDDIQHIEAFDDYLKIYLFSTGRFVITRMTMKYILSKLPENEFIRVHRSFIVPVKRITKIGSKNVFVGQMEIPIGKSYADQLLNIERLK